MPQSRLACASFRLRLTPRLGTMASKVLRYLVFLGLLSAAAVLVTERVTGTSLSVLLGGRLWLPVGAETPFVSKGVKAALADPVPEVVAGEVNWEELAAGFEVAEVAALAAGEEVDRLLLARIDPTRFRFIVHNDPSGKMALDDWRRATGALLVVNGSFYGRQGHPVTPTVIGGAAAGPVDYEASHGAFVTDGSGARIVDLAGGDWKQAFAKAEQAFVSYPLLLAEDGSTRAPKASKWLANRSFLAQDAEGRLIVGTTKDAFFSLARLAAFLDSLPLNLRRALNLDGGPVACQSVDFEAFQRRSCGRWDVRVEGEKARMLPPMAVLRDPPLPLVLAVYPK